MELIEPPSLLFNKLPILAGFGTVESILLIVLCLLLLASALVSGSEAAFFSLSPSDKEEIKVDESKKARYVENLMNRPKDLLATILITNNFVNVGIVILSSSLLTKILQPTPENATMHFIIEVVLITFTLLLIGEVIPKIYATKNALRFSKKMSRTLYLIDKTPPFSWLRASLVKGTSFIQSRASKGKVSISSDELEQALALTTQQDELDDDHRILEGIVRFGNTEVRQIMKPRLDVYAIEGSADINEVLDIILDCGHSRIPVYDGSFDKLLGVLFIKDLLPYLNDPSVINWKDLIRKPFFVPENKKIDDLLKEFQELKVHIAMVVDEYGGTSGIVTLEDVLEEIVGDITDEFDDDEIVYTKVDEKTYLFEGKTALIDFYKVLGIDERDLESDNKNAETLGGFIVENAGRILRNNEFVEVGKLKLIVESSDKKRIKMVKAIKNDL